MKTIAALLFIVSLFGGCVSAPQIPTDLCAEYDQSKSLLLKVAALKQIPLNVIYYGLIDVTAIGLATDQLDRDVLIRWMNEISVWYIDHYPISYTLLIEYMTETATAQQLGGILARRIGDFKSYMFISKYDDCMLRAGWNDAMDQLYLR